MIAQTYTYTVVLEPDDQAGGFSVHVPALPGCHTEADTRDEAIAMAQDAINAYIESLLAHNEPIPTETTLSGPVFVTVTVKSRCAPISDMDPDRPIAAIGTWRPAQL